MERVFSPCEIADVYADLPKRGEGDRQPVPRSVRFVDRHAPFGQRQRLLVPVLHHHDVGFIAAHRRHDIVGLDERGKPFGLPQSGHRFVAAAQLGKRDARKGMNERKMAPVTHGVKGRRRLRNVLSDDGDVADLAVTLTEFVVSETDGAGIVRDLGVLQRASVQRDGARLIAPGPRQPAVQPPQRRETRG